MEPQSSTELTKQAIALKQAGDAAGALPLLIQALNTTPNLEAAWLWLAACLTVPAEQRYCLEQALSANPESQPARAGLARFEQFAAVRPTVFGAEMIEAPLDIPLGEITATATATVLCPSCGAMTAPGRFCTECGRNMDTQVDPALLAETEATRPCPFCAETIKAAAVVCRFCGREMFSLHRQLLDRAMAQYTASGWEIVSQSDLGFQAKATHKVSDPAMAVLVVLPTILGVLAALVSAAWASALFSLALVCAALLALHHLTVAPQLLYISVEQLRSSTVTQA